MNMKNRTSTSARRKTFPFQCKTKHPFYFINETLFGFSKKWLFFRFIRFEFCVYSKNCSLHARVAAAAACSLSFSLAGKFGVRFIDILLLSVVRSSFGMMHLFVLLVFGFNAFVIGEAKVHNGDLCIGPSSMICPNGTPTGTKTNLNEFNDITEITGNLWIYVSK